MINTSADWKTYAQDNSYFHIKATMTGGSTLNLTDEDFILGSVSFTDSISGMDSIGFGAVITNSFSATLNNSSGKFDSWDWDEITVEFGIIYEDESEEWIQRGVYLIDRPTSISDTIMIKAYDYMDKLNRYFGGMTVTWPVNSSTLLQAICTYCGVDWGAWNCGPTFNVNLTDLTNESTTCRQVVSWVLETVGGHARINPTNNKLYCKCFSIGEWGVTTDYDGGTIDPWSTVTARDGGTIDPWSDSVVIDGGLFAGGAGYSINKIISQNVYIDDVEITGIRAYTYNTVDEFDFTTVGSDGYIISLQNNPVINANNNSAIATRCWNNVQGFAIRPFNAVIFGDPSIEAGDRITWMDTRSNSYVSVITNLTFTLSGEMRISCDAQSAVEHAIETANPETQLIAGAVTAAYDYVIAKKIAAEAIKAGSLGVNGTITTSDLIVQNGSQLGGFSVVNNKFQASYTIPYTYTSTDLTRIQQIILGNITPTTEDYSLYDLNGDGRITALDYVRINSAINNTGGVITCTITIDPSTYKGAIDIESNGSHTRLGAGGMIVPSASLSTLVVDGETVDDFVLTSIKPGTISGWRKWSSGTAEYWTTLTQTITNWGAWGSLYEATPGVRATYPADLFIEAPKVYALPSAGAGISGVETYQEGTTTNSPYFYALRPSTASTESVKIFVYAVGKWK